jgi:hypothetical protein
MDEMDYDKMQPGMDDEELLKRIAPEGGSADASVLSGVFLGRGTEENVLRLYTAMDLSQYFQIPQDKVLAVKRMPQGQVLVWVPRDLKVQVITSQTMPAEFLRGSIQSAFVSRARRSSGFGALARRALAADDPQPPSVFGGPFCQTDVPDPSNPICGLTAAGCPPGPGC